GRPRAVPARALVAVARALLRGGASRLLAVRDDLVNEAVLFGLHRRHDAVALHVLLDDLEGLARVLGENLRRDLAHAQDFFGLDADVCGLAAGAGDRGLVDEDARVRQREALAARARGEEQRAHRGALAEADRHHVGAYELHRVVDRHAGADDAARGVDVEVDVLLRVFGFEEEELRDDEVRHRVVNRRAEEDDVVAKQSRVDVRVALAARRLLEDRRVGDVLPRRAHQLFDVTGNASHLSDLFGTSLEKLPAAEGDRAADFALIRNLV